MATTQSPRPNPLFTMTAAPKTRGSNGSDYPTPTYSQPSSAAAPVDERLLRALDQSRTVEQRMAREYSMREQLDPIGKSGAKGTAGNMGQFGDNRRIPLNRTPRQPFNPTERDGVVLVPSNYWKTFPSQPDKEKIEYNKPTAQRLTEKAAKAGLSVLQNQDGVIVDPESAEGRLAIAQVLADGKPEEKIAVKKIQAVYKQPKPPAAAYPKVSELERIAANNLPPIITAAYMKRMDELETASRLKLGEYMKSIGEAFSVAPWESALSMAIAVDDKINVAALGQDSRLETQYPSAVCVAVYYGRRRTLEYLFKHGFDGNAGVQLVDPRLEPYTALDMAVILDRSRIIKLLFQNNQFDPAQVARALNIAIEVNHGDCISKIFKCLQRDTYNYGPLDDYLDDFLSLSAHLGNTPLIIRALEHGASVEQLLTEDPTRYSDAVMHTLRTRQEYDR